MDAGGGDTGGGVDAGDGDGNSECVTQRAAQVSRSTDGKRFALVCADSDGDDEIFIANADGSGLTQLTRNSASDTKPSWRPKGRIYFYSDRNESIELHSMTPDGSEQGRVRLRASAGDDAPVNG